MRKRNLRLTVYSALIFGLLIMVSSCKTEENVPAPSADFTFEVSGTTVTFTNTSTNGSTYEWDFGDGETSTEESPTHDYGKFAGFVVELTATNDSGSNKKSVAVQVVAQITIDGDFSDWESIPVASAINADNDFELKAVTELKVTSDLTNIYVYVKGTNDLGGFVSMYINSDGDTTTGWANKEHVFDSNGAKTSTMAGADYEIDLGGPWPSDGSFSYEIWNWVEDAANVDRAEWFFEGDDNGGDDKLVLPMKSGNEYEFAIVRAKFPGGLADVITFKFVDVDISNNSGVDWVETGTLPNNFEGYVEHELFK